MHTFFNFFSRSTYMDTSKLEKLLAFTSLTVSLLSFILYLQNAKTTEGDKHAEPTKHI